MHRLWRTKEAFRQQAVSSLLHETVPQSSKDQHQKVSQTLQRLSQLKTSLCLRNVRAMLSRFQTRRDVKRSATTKGRYRIRQFETS